MPKSIKIDFADHNMLIIPYEKYSKQELYILLQHLQGKQILSVTKE